LATPNYGYEKRQKELAKKRKKEDKLKEKNERKSQGTSETSDTPDQDATSPSGSQPDPLA